MNGDSATVSRPMAGVVTTADGRADIKVRLIYSARDPYVVCVTLTDPAGVIQIWTIGRDLLLAGLAAPESRPAGLDRVRSWVCEHPGGRSLMIAMLTRAATFLELGFADVAAFLGGTLEVVPQGGESGLLHLDAELRQLTA